jgi:SAM-dependent methyltransferase
MDLSEVPGAPFRRHPWEVARARFFGRVLRDAELLDAPRAVLDVGAGDGYLADRLLADLPGGSTLVCFDARYTRVDLTKYTAAARPGLSFVDRQPAARFDLLLALDVIEHVEDDRAFLDDLLRSNLAPGGAVLVSVPAWPALFSRHDEALQHHRRYSPAACRALLAACGLIVRRSGGLFHSLLLPRLVAVAEERISRRFGRERSTPPDLGAWRGGPVLSSMVARALAADNGLTRALARRGWALPGLSFWALCERSRGPGGEADRPTP